MGCSAGFNTRLVQKQAPVKGDSSRKRKSLSPNRYFLGKSFLDFPGGGADFSGKILGGTGKTEIKLLLIDAWGIGGLFLMVGTFRPSYFNSLSLAPK